MDVAATVALRQYRARIEHEVGPDEKPSPRDGAQPDLERHQADKHGGYDQQRSLEGFPQRERTASFHSPPPSYAGLSGERFTMRRVHARSKLVGPATFWLSRHRKDRACATAIAFWAIFSSRSRGAGSTALWIVMPAMPTTRSSRAGTIWWRWFTRSLAGSRACAPWRRRGTPTPTTTTISGSESWRARRWPMPTPDGRWRSSLRPSPSCRDWPIAWCDARVTRCCG